MNTWIDTTIHPITGFKISRRELTQEESPKDYDRRTTYMKKYKRYINEDRSKRGEVLL